MHEVLTGMSAVRDIPSASPAAAREQADGSNLTRSQFLLWMGQRMHPGVPLYNMVLAFTIDGRLDPIHFQQAFQALADRSDALRTVVEEVDGVPRQRVRAPFPYEIEQVDLSAAPDAEEVLREWVRARAARPFELSERLFDTALVRMPADRTVWFLNQHHLITDGWSTALVYRNVADLYARSVEGRLFDMPPLPAFGAYAEYERAFRSAPLFQKAERYWQERLTTPLEPVRLYGKREARTTTTTERFTVDLGDERSAKLRALASRDGVRALTEHLSLFHVFAAALFGWMHRVSGQHRLAIGTPSHNRPTAAFKETIGVFIEIFPFQIDVRDDDTFLTLLGRVRAEAGALLRYAQPGTSSPLVNRGINVLLNYINASFPPFSGLPMQSDWVHAGHGDRSHHLRLQVHDFDEAGRFLLHFDFSTDLFAAAEREGAIQHFLRILDAFLEDPARPIRNVDLLSDAERRRVLVDFNTTGDAYPSGGSVVSLFEAQAVRTPDAVALTCEGRSLTYDSLNEHANRLAHALRSRGVGPEVTVGLCTRRSAETVIGMLGVLKAGGAYVPIDPSFPEERIRLLLDEMRAPVLLTQSRLAGRLPTTSAHIICLDEAPELDREPVTNPETTPEASDLAYVLYTSGSTGRPKGVMIEHGALANYVSWAASTYLRGEPLDFPLFTPVSFDLTVTSIFVPLVAGGRIVVYPEDESALDLSLLRVIEDDAVDVVKLTPSHLALIRGRDLRSSRIKKLILGGEDLKTELARAVTGAFGGGVEIFNEYGPTEATVGCTIHRFNAGRDVDASVPIGRPAAGARILVLDEAMRPVPAGVAGELFIGGPGLARGYFRRPDLTEERFVADPSAEGARLYRTGDLGRWQPDGTLHYLGRTDHQVKVRGVRIELAEIEAALADHPAIEACVVEVARRSDAPEELFHCTRCGLPSNYPGAQYDAAGVCHLCRSFDAYRSDARKYFRNLDDLRALFEQTRQTNGGQYDCLMLLSGGKDSTYALYRLVGMGLRVLAFTLDNGYISEGAKANVRRVTEALGVEHVFATTPAMNAIFVDSLKRYSNVCNGCFKTVYALSLKLARERGIRFIVTGLSRGQFFETRLTEELFSNGRVDVDRIDRYILEARKAYHRTDDAVARLLNTSSFIDDDLLDEVAFIDFYRYCDVELDELLAFLDAHAPWIRPADTGRSTNCLINELGIFVHKKERGYHNYAFPYSWDVRMGHKTRDAALHELDEEIDPQAIQQMVTEIGYDVNVMAEEEPEAALVAYYAGDRAVPVAELRSHLARTLPAIMIPSQFVRLERLPLNAHGKVDRAALPRPESAPQEPDAAYQAPRNAVEERLAGIWAEVLRMDRVGIYDDFLALGGNSLLAIQIIARVNRAFGIDLSLQSALEASTIAALATRVEDALLAEIEGLSEEDARMLVEKGEG
jgi:amino acid adenylation domain-containing protein